MRVLFNTYPVAFGCPGGGEIQLLRSRQALEALHVEVPLYDPWHPQFGEVDLAHYFSVQGGSMNFCDYVKRIGLPLVISPILWITEENRPQLPLSEIRDLLHRSDRILPNSEAECRQLSASFEIEPEKFSPIPNGVDDRFAELADAELFTEQFDINEPFLLNVANIEPRKNQRMLAEVARRLDLPLVLVGRARDRTYLEAVLAAGGTRVRYLGWIEQRDPLLASAYRACRLFVLPSLLETPGLAALEAGTQQARLIVTGVGSTREYFGPHVAYVDPYDAESLRAAIEANWSAPADDALRSHVLENFTWRKAGAALLAAYQQTLLAASAVA